MNPRWISLAVLTTTVVLLGFVPAAQAEVRAGPNYKLDSDSSPFRGRDQTALAVNRGNPQHVVQINANYLDLTCESSVSTDGGSTWGTAVPIPNPAPAAGESPFIPSCSTFQSVEFGSGNNVYTTATAGRTTPDFPDSSTLVFRSTDGGRTWQPGVIAMAGGPGTNNNTNTGPSYSRPSLSVAPGGGTGGADRIYLTALGGNFNSVRTAVSNDAGATFSAGVTASPASPAITDSPSKPVVNSDGSVTIAWRTNGTAGLIQAVRSTDGGASWGAPVDVASVTNTGTSTLTHVPPVPLTGASASASYPRMVGGPGGDIYLVYSQGTTGPTAPPGGFQGADHFISPDSQVWFQRSRDNGATWSNPKRISEQTAFPGSRTHQTRHPTVSFAGGRINVVWHDRRHWYGGPGEQNCTHSHNFCDDTRLGDTYYSYSTDSGSNFTKPLRVSDRSMNDDVGYDTRPSAYWNFGPQSVTVGGDKVLIGWMDSREGNWDTDNEDTYLAKVDFNATGAPPRTEIAQSDAIARSVALSKLGYPAGNEGALVGGVRDTANPPGCVASLPVPAPVPPPPVCPGGPASRNASAVVIANQSDVPGALAGAVLARANPAPVLVSPALGLPASVKAEVSRIAPGGAFIIGDTSKLSSQVSTDLVAAGIPASKVTRISGPSDAAQAALIAARLDYRTQLEKDTDVPAFDAAVIANPASPDAAAAAGLATARRLPVLYVGGNSVPSETQAALDSLDIDKALVIGGPSSVSEDVRTQVGTLVGAPATRLGGANRYETSKAVVAESKGRGLPENVVYFADGAKPMDAALLGGLAARETGILVLAPAPLSTTAAGQAAGFGLTGISRLVLAVPARPGTPPVAPRPGAPVQPAAFPGCPTLTANVIRGTAAANTINGTTAADRIFAGTGNDVVDALAGNDCVDLGVGDDRGQGGLGSDLLISGTGKDRVSGSSGNDNVRGNSGNDRLDGGRGNDRLFGDSGNDTLLGSFGNDRLHGVSGRDLITGSRGRDRINGGAGNDRISGGSSADRIAGDAGSDRIDGNSGADRISGNSGADRIVSRDSSRDRVNCGSGRDTVVADRRDVVSRNCERVIRRR